MNALRARLAAAAHYQDSTPEELQTGRDWERYVTLFADFWLFKKNKKNKKKLLFFFPLKMAARLGIGVMLLLQGVNSLNVFIVAHSV